MNPPARPRVAAMAAVAAATLLLGTAGCGGATASGSATTSADAACRNVWQGLQRQLAHRDDGSAPAQLSDRWASIIAGVDYHALSATARDCDQPLTVQRDAIAELESFQGRIESRDMVLQLNQLAGSAQLYLQHPLTTSGGATQGSAHGASQGTPALPTAAQVTAALATLHQYAAQADADLADGWAEAEQVDLDDVTATDRAVSDLAYLASTSSAYQRCAAAVAVLRTVVQAQFSSLADGAPTPAGPSTSPAASPTTSPTTSPTANPSTTPSASPSASPS